MFGVRQAVLASLPRVGRAQQASRSLHVSRLAMAVQLKMPSLSPTMEEGTIVKWSKVEFPFDFNLQYKAGLIAG